MKGKEMDIKYRANILHKMLLLITINLFGITIVQFANILNLNLFIKLLIYGLEMLILLNLVYILSSKTYLKVTLKEDTIILKYYRENIELKYSDIKVQYQGLLNKKIVIIYENKKYRIYRIDYFNLKSIFNEIERRILCYSGLS